MAAAPGVPPPTVNLPDASYGYGYPGGHGFQLSKYA